MFATTRRHPGSTLFPYTTLFRSLPIGYFANVIEMDGVGIALCTDGVGTKTIIATMMGKYDTIDRKSTRLNSSHRCISYAVFCLKKKNRNKKAHTKHIKDPGCATR